MFFPLLQHPLWDITDKNENADSGEITMSFLRDMVARYPKSYYYIYGPFQPALVACSPDTVRAIMKSQGKHWHTRPHPPPCDIHTKH